MTFDVTDDPVRHRTPGALLLQCHNCGREGQVDKEAATTHGYVICSNCSTKVHL